MNKPFELAADAHTREIDCTHFSRSSDREPFCNCLTKPYCVAAKGSPEKCSFRISKTAPPAEDPAQRAPAARRAPERDGRPTMAVKWI